MVISTSNRKNLALQPPQKLASHLALGKAGHVVTSQGLITQLKTGTPGGHSCSAEKGVKIVHK